MSSQFNRPCAKAMTLRDEIRVSIAPWESDGDGVALGLMSLLRIMGIRQSVIDKCPTSQCTAVVIPQPHHVSDRLIPVTTILTDDLSAPVINTVDDRITRLHIYIYYFMVCRVTWKRLLQCSTEEWHVQVTQNKTCRGYRYIMPWRRLRTSH